MTTGHHQTVCWLNTRQSGGHNLLQLAWNFLELFPIALWRCGNFLGWFGALLLGFWDFSLQPCLSEIYSFPKLVPFAIFILAVWACASALCLVRICLVEGTKHVLWARYVSSQWTVSSFVVGVVSVCTMGIEFEFSSAPIHPPLVARLGPTSGIRAG